MKKKMNLTKMWPVLSEEWTEDLWNNTEFHRYNVNFFIDTDQKNTSRRTLYVSFEFKSD